MMRILAVSDAEDDVLVERLASGSAGRFDAVISCGDLRPSYLDYVSTMANAPLLYVRGNHDTDERGYAHMGGTPLDLHVRRVGALRVAGLDGSFGYRDGIVGYSERQAWVRALRIAMLARLIGGIDVLVTHAPPRGYGDMDDLPHRGFRAYNWLLFRLRPRLLLHGHVHLNYGLIQREQRHPSGALLVNAYGHWIGEWE